MNGQYNINDIKNLSLEQLFKLADSGNLIEPIKLTLPLDTAFDNKQLSLAGNYVGVVEATDTSTNINIGFNRSEVEKINFTKGLAIICPFDRLFITSDAQASKSITLLISSFAPQLFQVLDNRSEATQTTILEAIRDELIGASSGTYGTEKTIGTSQSQVLAANSSRKAFIIQSKAVNSGKIYIGFDNTVTSTKWIAELQAGQSLILDDWTGTVHAISDTAGQLLGYGEW